MADQQGPEIEGHDGITVIRSHDNFRGWNNIRYRAGMSGKNVGSKHLSMNVATVPPAQPPARSPHR